MLLPVAPRELSFHAGGPSARVLSNGQLTSLVTADGSGYVSLAWRRITSGAPDAVESGEGLYFYLRDEEDGALWSIGKAPVPGAPERCAVSAEPGMLRCERRERGIEASCEVTLAADAHVELRRIRLRNGSGRARRISVTSYVGIVLHHAGGHAGHPGFSKLFVQTRADVAAGLLFARRRPRGAAPEPLHLAHALFGPGAASFETDRARFVGRGRSLAAPAALEPGAPLSGTAGNVLDPIASWRRELVLAPGAEAELVSVLALAESEAAVRVLALAMAEPGAFDAVCSGAEQRARAELARLGLSPEQGAYLEALLVQMLYGEPSLRAPAEVFERVRGAPDDLWLFGIPPDAPLVVVEHGSGAATLARELETAIAYWASCGVAVRGLLVAAAELEHEAIVAARPDADPRALDAARACARLVLREGWPGLAGAPPPPRALRARPSQTAGTLPPRSEPLLLANGYGGFSADGRAYEIDIPPSGALPPMPWVNVLANPGFGSLVSERGAAHTWSRNSREHRVTPWSNDPISDPHGEALFVRDEDAGGFWSPQPGPAPGGGAYEVRHGFGHSRWRHRSHELGQEVTTLVAADAPVKLTRVRLTNLAGRARRLSVFSFARLVLGVLPEDVAHATVVAPARDGRTLLARNGLAGVFADGVAFASASASAADVEVFTSADRAGFVGHGGSLAAPRALAEDAALDGRSGARLDPCFAHQLRFTLPAGASVECVFALGEAASAAEAEALVRRFGAPSAFADAEEAVRSLWDGVLGGVCVETPSPALDAMVNGWLAYQTLACRIWGRTAFYQSGGAFGFRDQLQDSAAFVHVRPDLTRAQILLHAAHQFVEGDVLHWWHPPHDRGTRTRFSDDLLWLPWVAAQYIAVTGDASVLDEEAGFVTARQLEPGEHEAYLPTEPAAERASVFEHCRRAIERSLAVGAHGIPLMGTGDWNDGMNLVGAEGRGESVWMAFFLHDVLRSMEPLARERGEAALAERWAAHRAALARAVETHAWDGRWYRRAWFDDGSPLGTAAGNECRIDVLPQAWAVLSGAAPRARCEEAMDSLERELVLPEGKLIRLLAPPFDTSDPTPGYIQGYVPGIRENGGQYTHAASWAVRATAALGRRERAFALLEMILPPSHARTREDVAVYQVEPYVVVADIYAVPPHVGRGGWTWYTGSSGWLLRTALESILGLRMEGGRRLVLRPCVPDAWREFRITYCVPGSGTRYAIHVRGPSGANARVVRVRVDARSLTPIDGAAVWEIARDGGEHAVEVELGPEG